MPKTKPPKHKMVLRARTEADRERERQEKAEREILESIERDNQEKAMHQLTVIAPTDLQNHCWRKGWMDSYYFWWMDKGINGRYYSHSNDGVYMTSRWIKQCQTLVNVYVVNEKIKPTTAEHIRDHTTARVISLERSFHAIIFEILWRMYLATFDSEDLKDMEMQSISYAQEFDESY